MAYGFNLGQIEGLDSSVKTVALTIADQSTTNTYTLSYNETNTDWETDGAKLYDLGSSQGYVLKVSAFEASDVGNTYNVTLSISAVEENFKSAVETVLADNGLISESETIFDETLTLANEELYYELPSDFPDSWYENAVCTVNGMEIPKDPKTEYGFKLLTDAISVNVSYIPSQDKYPAELDFSYCDVQNDYAIIPGDYQVKIVARAESGGSDDNTRVIHINATPESSSIVESYETVTAMLSTQLPVIVVINKGDYSGYLSIIWDHLGVIYQTINPDLNLLLYQVYELIFDDKEKTVSVTHKLYTSALTPGT